MHYAGPQDGLQFFVNYQIKIKYYLQIKAMFVYVKFDDGTFKMIEDTQIPHLQMPYDRLKKYKVVVDGETKDAVIAYTAGKLYHQFSNKMISRGKEELIRE